MSRRQRDIRTLACPLTVRERRMVDDLKAVAGLGSDANLVRTALYALARHLDLEGLTPRDFGLRSAGRSTRVTRDSLGRNTG